MRNVCTEIPKQYMIDDDRRHGTVGELKMEPSGTRDATTVWQEDLANDI